MCCLPHAHRICFIAHPHTRSPSHSNCPPPLQCTQLCKHLYGGPSQDGSAVTKSHPAYDTKFFLANLTSADYANASAAGVTDLPPLASASAAQKLASQGRSGAYPGRLRRRADRKAHVAVPPCGWSTFAPLQEEVLEVSVWEAGNRQLGCWRRGAWRGSLDHPLPMQTNSPRPTSVVPPPSPPPSPMHTHFTFFPPTNPTTRRPCHLFRPYSSLHIPPHCALFASFLLHARSNRRSTPSMNTFSCGRSEGPPTRS